MDVLAKRTTAKWDLGAGEPLIVADALRDWEDLITRGASIYNPRGLYPRIGGHPQLIDRIKAWMQSAGHRVPKHVVVTCGAKQALAALVYDRVTNGYLKRITHLGPYWPTLKSIVTVAGGALRAVDVVRNGVTIVTSPNNLDGLQHVGVSSKIWDASYASPAYGWNDVHVDSVATVFSMAKLFGVPDIRVGWIATDDDEVAERVAAYVEVQTSGVASESQSRAAAILSVFQESPHFWLFCSKVSYSLERNRQLLERLWAGYVETFPRSVGMYFYCWPSRDLKKHDREIFHQALKKADVAYVPGTACGQEDLFYGSQKGASKYCYRFNLAQREAVVRGAAEAVLKAMR